LKRQLDQPLLQLSRKLFELCLNFYYADVMSKLPWQLPYTTIKLTVATMSTPMAQPTGLPHVVRHYYDIISVTSLACDALAKIVTTYGDDLPTQLPMI
jgi:hypothetical protein